ncbi:lamin tail domain-containing protein [Streptomyces sp. bgisy100]|uniref:lamin tail domain-containing protein n=1 Tax=Streptomyces sp. bgisy100 TaxID=3413783 RepID=UPI003D7306BE
MPAHGKQGINMSRTARTLTATALITGAMLTAAAMPASAHQDDRRHRGLEIGQVQYDAPGPDRRNDRSLNSEFFTVVNNGRHAVQLRNYTVSDRDGHTYTFDRLRLRRGQEVTVHTGHGRDHRWHRYQDSNRHLYDNNRGSLTLRTDGGNRVDQCRWGRGDGGHTDC